MALPRLRWLALLAVVLLLTGVEGCARKKMYGENTPSITTTVGEQIFIQLASNPTTGLSWTSASHPDPLVLALMSNEFVADPTTTFGTGGHHRWTFRAVGRGSATLKFNYGRTCDASTSEKSAIFTVVVK